MQKAAFSIVLGLSVILLVSCARSPAYDRPQTGSVIGGPSTYSCQNCGTVVSVTPVGEEGLSKSAGAIIGAVIGGLAGSQVGGGSGQDAATGVGAVGGAVAGSEMAEGSGAPSYYEVVVDMAVGGRRIINVESPRGLTAGTQVKVVGNDLHVLQ